MSSFEVKAKQLTIEPHSNADSLEIARIDGYTAIVPKGQYQTGDVAIYIPEAAVVPERIIQEMGLEGRLAGPAHNRVKAVRLRGVLSQGLVYTPNFSLDLDSDYSKLLEIVKWEPQIPSSFSGELISCGSITSYTDIENAKKFPNVFTPGEQVIVTEKLHGTLGIFHLDLDRDEFFVSSKGIAKNFHAAIKEDKNNVYWKAARKYKIEEALRLFVVEHNPTCRTITLYGEVIGVQDLKYGYKGDVGFNAFDIKLDSDYKAFFELDYFCVYTDVPSVPLLYRGPYSEEKIWELASGKEQYSGQELHIREGVVVKPEIERDVLDLGRVILKYVSEDYLLRNNKDATEYE